MRQTRWTRQDFRAFAKGPGPGGVSPNVADVYYDLFKSGYRGPDLPQWAETALAEFVTPDEFGKRILSRYRQWKKEKVHRN